MKFIIFDTKFLISNTRSDSTAAAQAALDGTADLTAQYTGLVTRKVDEMQATMSKGAMGEVMRKHVTARGVLLEVSEFALRLMNLALKMRIDYSK